MVRFVLTFLAFFCLGAPVTNAFAGVVARVDKSQQTMHVFIEGSHAYSWPVSTGRRGYNTPVGSYRPTVLSRFHRSSKYYGSPMPHSVFFRGGYAIHGSYEVRSLGRPASHGCIRLHPAHAAHFFHLVRSYGLNNTRIIITR
jgi:lipoprotein-anchoring transpeptidase ErfK/SrfK